MSLDCMREVFNTFLRCLSNRCASGWKSTDGVWKVKATHSASELASLLSLALAAADRFKSPPGAREGNRQIKQ